MLPSSATAYSALTDFNSKRQGAQDIYKQANDQYDVTGGQQRVSSLKGLVGNLQSSLDAVDPSVTGRTTGTFTTEGQRSALVNREQQPILGNLSKTQSNLGNEQSNLTTSQGLASQLASALLSQDNTRYQSLLDQYNAAVSQEQAAEAKRQWEAQQAEQKRQFDVQQANAKAAAGGAGNYNLGSAAAAAAPASQQRADGGFNFQDASGKAISAAKYAQLTNQPIQNVIKSLADSGDQYAATAYFQLSKSGWKNAQKQFPNLFWGV